MNKTMVKMLFLTGGLILSCHSLAAGTPFATNKKLKAEVTARTNADIALQSQINNISLTPGPQGPVGPPGLTSNTFAFDLAAGASSAAIPLPQDVPVQVIGVSNTGVAQATLMSKAFGGGSGFILWTGLESPAGSVITQGGTGFPGTHILFLDFDHLVDIKVNNPTSIRVSNSSAGRRTGIVKLIW